MREGKGLPRKQKHETLIKAVKGITGTNRRREQSTDAARFLSENGRTYIAHETTRIVIVAWSQTRQYTGPKSNDLPESFINTFMRVGENRVDLSEDWPVVTQLPPRSSALTKSTPIQSSY